MYIPNATIVTVSEETGIKMSFHVILARLAFVHFLDIFGRVWQQWTKYP